TFMAVTKVKDDNIVQAMLQAKSDQVDKWNEFQAKSTKQKLAEIARDQIHLQRLTTRNLSPAAAAAFTERERFYAAEASRYSTEKQPLEKEADDLGKQYDRFNFHDDQFDLSD